MAATLGPPPGLSATSSNATTSNPTSNPNNPTPTSTPTHLAHTLPSKPSPPTIQNQDSKNPTSMAHHQLTSDQKESSDPTSSPPPPSKKITRPALDPNRPKRVYSRPGMLHLSKSPLVNIPDGMPPLSHWYGEWHPPTSNRSKSDHNQSIETSSTTTSPHRNNLPSAYNNGHRSLGIGERDEAPHHRSSSRRNLDKSDELEPSSSSGGRNERRNHSDRDRDDSHHYLPNSSFGRRNLDGTSRKDSSGGGDRIRRYEDRDGSILGTVNSRSSSERFDRGSARERERDGTKDSIGIGKNPFGQISASGTFKPAGTSKLGGASAREISAPSRGLNGRDFGVLREKKKSTKDANPLDEDENDGWESVPKSPETERRLARAAADNASDWRRSNNTSNQTSVNSLGSRLSTNPLIRNKKEIEERRRIGVNGGVLGNNSFGSLERNGNDRNLPSWMNGEEETPAWMVDDEDQDQNNRDESRKIKDRDPIRSKSKSNPLLSKNESSLGDESFDNSIDKSNQNTFGGSTPSDFTTDPMKGIDSIQAFKLEMKEKERREKERSRKEMEFEQERRREREKRLGISSGGSGSGLDKGEEKKEKEKISGPPPGLEILTQKSQSDEKKDTNESGGLDSIPTPVSQPNSASIFDTFSNSHSSSNANSSSNSTTNNNSSIGTSTGRSRFASRFGKDPQAAALAAQSKLLGSRSPSLNENGPSSNSTSTSSPVLNTSVDGSSAASAAGQTGNASTGALAQLFANASIGKKDSSASSSTSTPTKKDADHNVSSGENPPQSDAASMQRIMALLSGAGGAAASGAAGGGSGAGAGAGNPASSAASPSPSPLVALLAGRSNTPQQRDPIQSPQINSHPSQPPSNPSSTILPNQQSNIQRERENSRPDSRGSSSAHGPNVGMSPHYLQLQHQQQQMLLQQQQGGGMGQHNPQMQHQTQAQMQHQHAQQQAQLHLMRQQALEAQARASALRGGMNSTPPPGWGNAGSGNRPSPSLSPGPGSFGGRGAAGSNPLRNQIHPGGPPGIPSPMINQNGQGAFGLGLSSSSNSSNPSRSNISSPVNESGPPPPGPPPIPPASLRQQQQQAGSGPGPNLSGLPLHVQQQLVNMPPHIQMQFLQRNFPPPPSAGPPSSNASHSPNINGLNHHQNLPPHLMMQQQQQQQQQQQYNGLPPLHPYQQQGPPGPHHLNPQGLPHGPPGPLPPPQQLSYQHQMLQQQQQQHQHLARSPHPHPHPPHPPPGLPPHQGEMNLMALLGGNQAGHNLGAQ